MEWVGRGAATAPGGNAGPATPRDPGLPWVIVSVSPAAPAQVRATTRLLADAPADLVTAAPASTGTLCFLHNGDGLLGWGVHASTAVAGPGAAAAIKEWFDEQTAELAVADDVGIPGSGPVAFVSLGFDDSDISVAVIPALLLGRRDGVTFSTVIGAPGLTTPSPIRPPGRISYSDASLSVAGFTSAVAVATARIAAGELEKVVLAHDLAATTENEVDERFLLRELAWAYPSCFTYSVDGLVGASPEMLIRRIGGTLLSRVLAGTAWPEHAGEAVADGLMASRKDLSEHHFAVRSVARTLSTVADRLTVPEAPHPLALANLTHLATDITGTMPSAGPDALTLAAILHPTAAVGGTPSEVALSVIRELEPLPRGRYAAPVGWLDTAGDGEFAIALRCAAVDGRSVRMMAGCGIVADSDPDTEAREAQVKMIPIRDALEAQT